MASNKIPWSNLWRKLWSAIPNPLTDDGRLLLALDDFINPKTGRKIFGCAHIFDHAAKANQSKYPWAQNVVLVGLLKRIKGRWACIPLAYRFYLPKKALAAKKPNMEVPGETTEFQTKLQQAVEMVVELAKHFVNVPITIVCDSWFGNNGLFKPLHKHLGILFNLLSRLRSNTVLYAIPSKRKKGQRGATRKYGNRLGLFAEMAAQLRSQASCYSVFLYGHYREVQAVTRELKQDIGSSKAQARNAHAVINHINFSMMAATVTWIYGARLENTPERRHKVKGRNSFAFSDLRHIIAKAALSEDFDSVCHKQEKLSRKSFVTALLHMAA